jgi:hypothetical protein
MTNSEASSVASFNIKLVFLYFSGETWLIHGAPHAVKPILVLNREPPEYKANGQYMLRPLHPRKKKRDHSTQWAVPQGRGGQWASEAVWDNGPDVKQSYRRWMGSMAVRQGTGTGTVPQLARRSYLLPERDAIPVCGHRPLHCACPVCSTCRLLTYAYCCLPDR